MREKYFDSLKHLEVVYRLVLQASNKFINLRERKRRSQKVKIPTKLINTEKTLVQL